VLRSILIDGTRRHRDARLANRLLREVAKNPNKPGEGDDSGVAFPLARVLETRYRQQNWMPQGSHLSVCEEAGVDRDRLVRASGLARERR
jgi:hypothetical protein